MLKQVILDMGNVLLNYDPEYALSRFCESEETRTLIRQELFHGPEWAQADLGLITNEERYDGVSRRIPAVCHEALRQCVLHWDECMVPLPGAMAFLEQLRAWRLGIYVLSNACSRFRSYFSRSYALSLFDGVVVSSEVHLVKPDARIYRLLLEKYRLDPTECLFVDDRKRNTDGGEAVGIPGYVFDGDFDALTQYVEELIREGRS